MIIGTIKEKKKFENRVAISPDEAKSYIKLGHQVQIEKNAGSLSGFSDKSYKEAGATLSSAKEILKNSDILLKINCPSPEEAKQLKSSTMVVSQLNTQVEMDTIKIFNSKKISAFSLERVPRITRAQDMDILSSQANLAGYHAVIDAAQEFNRVLPLFMTAAGKVTPANVLVIGAGVAGLQAIATAKRLGARVEAFDTRDVVEEQVKSLGAKFVKIDLGETGETDQGYAKELTPEQIEKQKELQSLVCERSDIVITTAQLFGRPAPRIIDNKTIEKMKPGSVIFDMAVETGGNVEGSIQDEVVIKNGVKILGISNLASKVSGHASLALSNNFNHWICDFYDAERNVINFDFDDEIIKSSVLVYEGSIMNERFK